MFAGVLGPGKLNGSDPISICCLTTLSGCTQSSPLEDSAIYFIK